MKFYNAPIPQIVYGLWGSYSRLLSGVSLSVDGDDETRLLKSSDWPVCLFNSREKYSPCYLAWVTSGGVKTKIHKLYAVEGETCCRRFVLRYADAAGASIAYIRFFQLGSILGGRNVDNLCFNPGQVSTVDEAFKAYVDNPPETSIHDDEEKANKLHALYVSDMDRSTYTEEKDDGSTETHTVYSIKYTPYTTSFRFDPDSKSLLYVQTRPESADHSVFVPVKLFYTDFNEGKENENPPLGSCIDDTAYGFNLLYSYIVGFKRSKLLDLKFTDAANISKTTGVSVPRRVTDFKTLHLYMYKRNRIVYEKYGDDSSVPEAFQTFASIYAAKTGVEIRIAKSDDVVGAFSSITDETKLHVREGYIARVYILHIDGTVIVVDDRMREISGMKDPGDGDNIFAANYVDGESRVKKVSVIGGMNVLSVGGKLYKAASRLGNLNVSQKYVNNHPEYRVGSTGNKYDKDNPAMCWLREVSIIQGEGSGYDKQYSFEYVEKEQEDQDKLFVETIGTIAVEYTDGVNATANTLDVNNVVHLFFGKDDKPTTNPEQVNFASFFTKVEPGDLW